MRDAEGLSRSGRTTRDDRWLGILLMIASTAFFSLSEAVAKTMTLLMPAIEVAWLRYCVFAAIVAATALASRSPGALSSGRPGLQILRSLASVFAAIFFIVALSFLQMAEVTSIAFVSPLLVTALSIPILGEKVGVRRWAAIAAGLVGVLVVIRPGTGAFDPASVLPLLSAASWALAIVVTRLMNASDGPMVSLAYAALVGLAVTSLIVPFAWVAPDLRGLALGLATGVFGSLAQWLLILALRHERASTLAPFFYGNLVWSILLGFVLFGNLPGRWTYVGAALIVASGLYAMRRDDRHAR